MRKEKTRGMTKTRRSKRKDLFTAPESDPASKREILKAALSLFVRHAPTDPTARQIAARAGYSNPAIFKYFRTKDDLALYLFKQCYERVTGEFREAIQPDRPFQENIQALLRAYRRIVEEDLAVFLYATENTRRFWQSLPRDLRQRSLGVLLRRIFEKGKAEGVVRGDADTELLVVGVVGLLSQFARMYYFEEFQGPARNWIAAMERMIIQMCG